MSTSRDYTGGCHCGAVRFIARLPEVIPYLIDCNCSICVKKGIVHCPVEREDFCLERGEGSLRLYQFHSRAARHWFCGHCGIHVYGVPRNAPERLTVNARCLDDFEAIRARARLRTFDGRNHPRDASGDDGGI